MFQLSVWLISIFDFRVLASLMRGSKPKITLQGACKASIVCLINWKSEDLIKNRMLNLRVGELMSGEKQTLVIGDDLLGMQWD